jgi:hypothetical protein
MALQATPFDNADNLFLQLTIAAHQEQPTP